MSGLRPFIPPAAINLLIRLGLAGNRFKHSYSSWEEAAATCTGYQEKSIANQVLNSSRLVRDGVYVYERDGVVFDEIQYSWELLSALLGTPRQETSLRVLDWGGSLGSTYRQNRDLLHAAGLEVHWTVLEQPHLVEIGSNEFTNPELSFISDVNSIADEKFDVVLFASSICYLEFPKEAIKAAVKLRPSRIIFDRTPHSKTHKDLVGVQKVGRGIYRASYPIRSFAEGSLAQIIGDTYCLVSEWESNLQPDPQTVAKGLVFQRNPVQWK
jgi:putative methyltransferase (TIGR04325 family)